MGSLMESYDFVIIGAGPAGEAAAHEARRRDASVLILDREWFGGSCPHIGCVPSKALLNSAACHLAEGAAYDWPRASARRDYMVNRAPEASEPDDSGHIRALEAAGAATIHGSGRIVAPGRVEVASGTTTREFTARHIVVAVGSTTAIPQIPGIDEVPTWTNREATLARELPGSLLVLGGGPTGCELAQVYARFGVPTTIVQSGARILPHDDPRNAVAVRFGLERDGVTIRTGVRAVAAHAGAGSAGAHVIDLDDGTTAEGAAVLLAVGRTIPLAGLGLEAYGFDVSRRTSVPSDGRLRIADGLWLVGDAAGPELHTHQGHYQGELAIRMALGEPVAPDYRALPRATYTDPEAASVGLTLDEALGRGLEALEFTVDYPSTAKGYSIEAETGHVTIVVDRATRELVGAAIACPDASAAIHEAVLAIRARVPLEILADTIHAFPSTSRIFNGLFNDAARALATAG